MKKSATPRVFIIIVCMILMLAGTVTAYTCSTFHVPPLTDSELEESGIEKADKLLIVAHPDDDMLWGGAHLMDGDYFIVVVTNRNNAKRSREFHEIRSSSSSRSPW